jgi:hypothetical protein
MSLPIARETGGPSGLLRRKRYFAPQFADQPSPTYVLDVNERQLPAQDLD